MSRYDGDLGRFCWLGVVVLCALCAAAQGAVVVQYNFDASNDVANAKDANVTASLFQIGPGNTNPQFDIGWNGVTNAGWSRKADNWSTNGLDTNKWYGFVVTLNPGYRLAATSLTFDAFRRQEGPPTQLQVRVSMDGAAFQNYGGALAMGPTSVWTSFDIQSPLANITNSITVRIYGYDASVASRSLRIDNVTLNGTVTPNGLVPPTITSIGPSDTFAALIGVPSATSFQYTLQSRDDLLSGVWADVSGQVNVDGTGALLVLSDAGAVSAPVRFYRVKKTPGP